MFDVLPRETKVGLNDTGADVVVRPPLNGPRNEKLPFSEAGAYPALNELLRFSVGPVGTVADLETGRDELELREVVSVLVSVIE